MTALGILLCAAALVAVPPAQSRVPILRQRSAPRRLDGRARWIAVAALALGGVAVAAAVGGGYLVGAGAIASATAWNRSRKARLQRAHRQELGSLISGLEVVIGELRVGSHPAIACSTAASECSGSVARAFTSASGRARLGGLAHESFKLAGSPVSDELGRLSSAWRVADEHGLALVGLLAAVRGDMLARNRFRDRTQAALAGARATGTVLACLPIVGVLLGQMMGAAPIEVLLGGGIGGILLMLGTGLACAGLMWTDAITERVCR